MVAKGGRERVERRRVSYDNHAAFGAMVDNEELEDSQFAEQTLKRSSLCSGLGDDLDAGFSPYLAEMKYSQLSVHISISQFLHLSVSQQCSKTFGETCKIFSSWL